MCGKKPAASGGHHEFMRRKLLYVFRTCSFPFLSLGGKKDTIEHGSSTDVMYPLLGIGVFRMHYSNSHTHTSPRAGRMGLEERINTLAPLGRVPFSGAI